MINLTVALLREVSTVVELASHSGSLAMPIPKSVAQVRALLTIRIQRGDPGYQSGDKLPTHEELAAQLPSSRASVARAIALLKDDGLLVGIRGSGVYVAERPTDG
jgi:DNA-binding GntR family transcriptional regulator